MHSSKHTKHFIYPWRDAWFLLPGFLGFALWYLVPFGMSLAASDISDSDGSGVAGVAGVPGTPECCAVGTASTSS